MPYTNVTNDFFGQVIACFSVSIDDHDVRDFHNHGLTLFFALGYSLLD
jgi:hypothetical protein